MREERVINNFLRSITILSHLSNNSINKIQANLIKKTFTKGESILEEGQTLDHVYLIYQGDFTIYKRIEVVFQIDEFQTKKENKKVGVVQISKSQFFGSFEILKQTPSEFQLTSCSDECVAFLLPKSDFFNVVTIEDSHLSRVEKICQAWNQFLVDLITKAKELIISKKQFLLQNKLQIKELQKIQRIQEAKPLDRFLPELNLNTPKSKRISQQEDISSVKNTINELLPSRIKSIKSMINLQKKSDIFSQEYYENTNDIERAKLDQVHYDKKIVNFNLQNRLNIVYNNVEIFKYSKNDEILAEQPRSYKNELLQKLQKIRRQTEEDQNSMSPKSQASPKHENYFRKIDKRLNDLKNKYSDPTKNKSSLVSFGSLKNLDYFGDQNKSINQSANQVNFPMQSNFSSGFSTPKSVKSMVFSKFSNQGGSLASLQNTKNTSPHSTPL